MSWKPTEDFCIRLSDMNGEARTDEQLQEMVKRMRVIANEFNFDTNCYGSWKAMGIVMDGEREMMNKYK